MSFHLAGPPYFFSPAMLGALFFTYLVSSPLLPWTGRAIALFGRRRFVLAVIALWIVGALLLLAPPVTIIIAGLTLCAVCGMLCQTISTGYVTLTAKEGRSSAVGLYASIFYIGGSCRRVPDRHRLDDGRLERLRRGDRRHAARHGGYRRAGVGLICKRK